jgi:hypothetical protein
MNHLDRFILGGLLLLPGCGPGEGATSTATGSSSGGATATDGSTGTNSGASGSTGAGTDAPTSTGLGSTTDTGGDSDTGDACGYSSRRQPPYHVGNASYAWKDPVDEDCTVIDSEALPGSLELRMDCPLHAMQNGGEQVEVFLQSGPIPGAAPQVGDSLHVFYQLGGDDVPRPGLLFLHHSGQLIYFAVDGFFVFSDDLKNANKYSPPLTVNLRSGPCPLVPNPSWMGAMTGFVCEFEGPAQMEFVADGPPLLLSEGMSGEIQAGSFKYVVDVRLARRGQGCAELEGIERQTVAGALSLP